MRADREFGSRRKRNTVLQEDDLKGYRFEMLDRPAGIQVTHIS
jgi:hypothetical protein